MAIFFKKTLADYFTVNKAKNKIDPYSQMKLKINGWTKIMISIVNNPARISASNGDGFFSQKVCRSLVHHSLIAGDISTLSYIFNHTSTGQEISVACAEEQHDQRSYHYTGHVHLNNPHFFDTKPMIFGNAL